MNEKLEEFFFFLEFKRGDIFLNSKEGANTSNIKDLPAACAYEIKELLFQQMLPQTCAKKYRLRKREIQIKKKRNTY